MIASPSGLSIPRDRIRELTRQCLHHNVFPIFLPNAFWSKSPRPVFRILDRLVGDHVELLACLSKEELATEIDAMPIQLKELLGGPPNGGPDDEYLQRLSLYWLTACMEKGYTDFRSALEPFGSGTAVAKHFPELLECTDDDGLLILDERFQLMDGGIEYREHVLHYHQCLRRGFGSNPNFDFTSRFAAYQRNCSPSNVLRIGIDPRRIMSREEYQQMMEMDTWVGAQFDPLKIDDHDSIGLTVIERERPSLLDMSVKLDRTEFFWKSDRVAGIKTFELEEVSAPSLCYDVYHINRYVHAERDTTNHVLRHFDGAAKVYASDADYAQRYESRIPNEPRAFLKPKLFRIDGNIEVADWIDLTTAFMKGNEMVVRYFDPAGYEAQFREKLEAWKTIRTPITSS